MLTNIFANFLNIFVGAGECYEGHDCRKQVWESWFLKYHTDNDLYTLYASHQVLQCGYNSWIFSSMAAPGEN